MVPSYIEVLDVIMLQTYTEQSWESWYWDIQPNSVDSFNNTTDPFALPFFDFFQLFLRLNMSKMAFITTWDLQFWAQIHITVFFDNFCIGIECNFSCQNYHLFRLLYRQSLPSNWVREKTLLPEAIVSWLKLHESPVEHCQCASHWKHSHFPFNAS